MTRIIWNKDYVDALCKKDGSTLIDNEYKYNRDMTYTFKCKCGDTGSKTGRRIQSNAALCTKCTQKTGDKKGNISRDNKRTDEEKESILQSNESNIKKEENEKKLCEWRNNLIKDIIPESNKWYHHPLFTNYEANTNGDVQNKETKKIIKGSTKNDGRLTITINRQKKQKHRIVMECLYRVEISLDYDIDHIDQNPGNNNFNNLAILTRKEHCAKTAATNPERGKKATQNSSKCILCQKLNEKGECIEKLSFISINNASKAMEIRSNTIRRSIQTNKPTKSRYLFSEEESNDIDIPEEKWEEYEKTNLYVSNKGRIWRKDLPVDYKTNGSKNKEGYYTISYRGNQLKVHKLVALLFIGKEPTQDHTVDHIDQNPGNNNAENLRWATKSEQAKNRSNVHQIEVYNYITGEIIDTFETSKDCCKKYNVKESIVSSALSFGIKQFKRGRSLGNNKVLKYLSARDKNLTNEKKLNREIDILNHELVVLMTDKNKRKSNEENLPVHITKSKSTYELNITFRGTKYRKRNNTLADLLLEKDNWIKKQKDYYTILYTGMYC